MEKLLNLIKNEKKSNSNEINSTNILVYSKFGNGKTTLKNNIKSNLEKEKEYKVYDVNIWQNENIDIIDNILLTILMKSPELFDKREILSNISNFIINKCEKVKNFISIFEDLTKNKYDDFIKNIENKYNLDNTLKKIFKDISEQYNDKKVVFLFDELDRCTEEYIKTFFSKIKIMFDFPNFVHIIFANKNVLNNIFQTLNINNEEYFLEKFLTAQYQIENKPLTLLFDIFKKYINNFNNLQESFKYLRVEIKKIYNNISFREITKQKENIKIFLNLIKTYDFYSNNDWFWTIILLIIKNKYVNFNEANEFIKEIWSNKKLDFPNEINKYYLDNIPDKSVCNLLLLTYNLDIFTSNISTLINTYIKSFIKSCCEDINLLSDYFYKIVTNLFIKNVTSLPKK